MALSPTSSEGGGNTTAQVVASGAVVPVAAATSPTVDTTTYADPIAGGGAKLTTLLFDQDRGLLATALAGGDTFPRWLFAANSQDGIYMGDGTFDAYAAGGPGIAGGGNHLYAQIKAGGEFRVSGGSVYAPVATLGRHAPQISQLSPLFTITSGALPTVALVSGTGAQISTTRDAETVTPFTGDGTNNAATCAIALSPDNVTYSTLATISIAAALNLTGVLTDTVNCRVPAGWYLKLTATRGTLGTTTYY